MPRRKGTQKLQILALDSAVEQLAAFVCLALKIMLELLGRRERKERPGRKPGCHPAKLGNQLADFLLLTDPLAVRRVRDQAAVVS